MPKNIVIYVTRDIKENKNKKVDYDELIEDIEYRLNHENSINPGIYDTRAYDVKKLDKKEANKELDDIISDFNGFYIKYPNCKENHVILREKDSPILTINIENMRYAFSMYKEIRLKAIQDMDIIECYPLSGRYPSMVLSLIGQNRNVFEVPFICTESYAMDYITSLFTLTAEALADFAYDKTENNIEHKENTFPLLVLGVFSFKYINA